MLVGVSYKIHFTSAARRAKAPRKLGVSTDQVASATEITPLLRAGGGLKAALAAMRFSQDLVVKCFLENTIRWEFGPARILLVRLLASPLVLPDRSARSRAAGSVGTLNDDSAGHRNL